MVRKQDYLSSVPDEQRKVFIDENVDAPLKLSLLKNNIKKNFGSKGQVVEYLCRYHSLDEATGFPRLDGLDKAFGDSVLSFFKKRIASMYPEIDSSKTISVEEMEAIEHNTFMNISSQQVCGRGELIETVCLNLFSNPLMIFLHFRWLKNMFSK